MAKLVFGMNQSLDGYVDHLAFAPGPALFRHFIEQVRGLAGSVYGRRMYEVMRYWDEDRPEWGVAEHARRLTKRLKGDLRETVCEPFIRVLRLLIFENPRYLTRRAEDPVT